MRVLRARESKLYYEKLALEVGATVAGFDVVKPAVLTGASGVVHSFTFVAAEGSTTYAFDVYREVGEVEMIRTYIKKMDTGARTLVVCLSGKPKAEALRMADCYGIELLGPKEVGDFFSRRISQLVTSVGIPGNMPPPGS